MITFKEYYYQLKESHGPAANQAARLGLEHLGHGMYGKTIKGKTFHTHEYDNETGKLNKVERKEVSGVDKTPSHPAGIHDSANDRGFTSVGRGLYKRVYNHPTDSNKVIHVVGAGVHNDPSVSKVDTHAWLSLCKHDHDKHLPKIGDINNDHPKITQYESEKLHDVPEKHDELKRHVSRLHNALDDLHGSENPPTGSYKEEIHKNIDKHKKLIQDHIDKHPELQKNNSADSIESTLTKVIKHRTKMNDTISTAWKKDNRTSPPILPDLHSGNIMHRIEGGHHTVVVNDPYAPS